MATRKDDNEKKTLEEMNANEIIKEYFGNISCSCRGGSYSGQQVATGALTLVSMIKENKLEAKLLKEKVEFLERILNQILSKAEQA